MSALSDAAKEAKRKYQREYARKWRKENPEKVKESHQKYWEKKARELDE